MDIARRYSRDLGRNQRFQLWAGLSTEERIERCRVMAEQACVWQQLDQSHATSYVDLAKHRDDLADEMKAAIE